MKTKEFFLFLASFALTTFCYTQDLSENTPSYTPLSQIDSFILKAENPALMSRRAAFAPSRKYKSLRMFINTHIEFPADARLTGTTGAVIAHFQILSNGSLGQIYFIQSPDHLFSQEVERVLRMAPPFLPAVEGGKSVSSFEQIKINFSLQ